MMNMISLRREPERLETFIAWFQARWASEESRMVYRDCMERCLTSSSPLPQWYLLMDGEDIIGGAGLIANDFISRQDLWPWLCALYIEPCRRGHEYGKRLIERAEKDAARAGFSHLYLCTDHVGYYERYGFSYVGTGWHPWGESSRVYEIEL